MDYQKYEDVGKFFIELEQAPYKTPKVIMQGKLFQRCKHHLYIRVLSLGGNVNTRRMSKSDIGSIIHLPHK